MKTGYELPLQELDYLFRVMSPWHRKQMLAAVGAVAKKRGGGFQFLDKSGAEISFAEVHRWSQASPSIQRQFYNLWMSYAR